MPRHNAEFTPKEHKFCLAYIANGLVGGKAVIAAGFKTKTPDQYAYELLQKEHIKRFISKKAQKIEEKLNITAEWKIKKLKQCIDCSIIEEDGKVNLINHKAVLGAISELNKMQGDYAPVRTENTHQHSVDMDQLHELLAEYEREY